MANEQTWYEKVTDHQLGLIRGNAYSPNSNTTKQEAYYVVVKPKKCGEEQMFYLAKGPAKDAAVLDHLICFTAKEAQSIYSALEASKALWEKK